MNEPSADQVRILESVMRVLGVESNIADGNVRGLVAFLTAHGIYEAADLEWFAVDRERADQQTQQLFALLTPAGQDLLNYYFAHYRLVGQGVAPPFSALQGSSAPAHEAQTLSGRKRGRPANLGVFFEGALPDDSDDMIDGEMIYMEHEAVGAGAIKSSTFITNAVVFSSLRPP
jgi:hypothetical protein